MKLKYFFITLFVLSVVGFADTTQAASGTLEIIRVGPDGLSSSAPSGTVVKPLGGTSTSDNPLIITDSIGNNVSFTNSPDHEEVVAYCEYLIGGTPCTVLPKDFGKTYSGTSENMYITGVPVYANKVTRLVIKYGIWGAIRVTRVGPDGLTSSAPVGTSVVVTDNAYIDKTTGYYGLATPPTGGPLTTKNPAYFPSLNSVRPHYYHLLNFNYISDPFPAVNGATVRYLYTALVATCSYPIGGTECIVSSKDFNNGYRQGNFGSIPGYNNMDVITEQGMVTNVFIKYLPTANTTSSTNTSVTNQSSAVTTKDSSAVTTTRDTAVTTPTSVSSADKTLIEKLTAMIADLQRQLLEILKTQNTTTVKQPTVNIDASASTKPVTNTQSVPSTPPPTTTTPTADPKIESASLKITTETLPSATVGSPYSATIQAIGGTDSYKWQIEEIRGGALPSGLYSYQGVCATSPCKVPFSILGTPSGLPSSTSFNVILTSGGYTIMKNFNIVVNSIVSPDSKTGQGTSFISQSSLAAIEIALNKIIEAFKSLQK